MTDFPNNPTLNQTFTALGRTWKWNGSVWQAVTQGTNWDEIVGKPATFTPTSHNHDDRYYTETEVDAALAGKQAAGSYATAAQGTKADSALQPGAAISSITGLQTALDGKQASGSYAPATGISPSAITGTAVVTNDSRLSDARTPLSHLHSVSDVTGLQTALDGKQASGNYATLVGGLVPSSQLPSYVDDVIEVANFASLPNPGEVGKIYVTDGKIYRWSGSAMVEISPSPGSTDAVPEGSTNLYHTTSRASAAAPVQSVAGRTGTVTLAKGDVGLDNVDNTSDANKPISTATQTALNGKAATNHGHAAGDITSGTLPIERGGTGATTAEAARTALGATISPQIDRFATPGTYTNGWTKPAGAKQVLFECVAGGGGGGRGLVVGAGTAVSGGSGGGSGGYSRVLVNATDLTDATYTVTVGSGGLGGTAGAAGAGTASNVSGATLGIFVNANGGGAGNVGVSGSGSAAGGAGTPSGNTGGTGNITGTGGGGAGSNYSAPSGGAGGGCSTTSPFNGGNGGTGVFTASATSTGGTASTTGNGGNGSNGPATRLIPSLVMNGGGGAGGGASTFAGATGGSGGNATGYGGGGGGGGSVSAATGTGGNGGAGAGGIVIITTYF